MRECYLGYLYYSTKLLSRHGLEQQDLEGSLEDPRRGWKRRFWLLMAVEKRAIRRTVGSVPVHFNICLAASRRNNLAANR